MTKEFEQKLYDYLDGKDLDEKINLYAAIDQYYKQRAEREEKNKQHMLWIIDRRKCLAESLIDYMEALRGKEYSETEYQDFVQQTEDFLEESESEIKKLVSLIGLNKPKVKVTEDPDKIIKDYIYKHCFN